MFQFKRLFEVDSLIITHFSDEIEINPCRNRGQTFQGLDFPFPCLNQFSVNNHVFSSHKAYKISFVSSNG